MDIDNFYCVAIEHSIIGVMCNRLLEDYPQSMQAISVELMDVSICN